MGRRKGSRQVLSIFLALLKGKKLLKKFPKSVAMEGKKRRSEFFWGSTFESDFCWI
jgi:hypothetical protein